MNMRESQGQDGGRIKIITKIVIVASILLGVILLHNLTVVAKDNFTPTIKPKKSEYIISSDQGYPPFEYQNEQHKYVGIEVELIKRIGELNKFNLKMEFIGFNAAMEKVQSGQSDGVMGGVTITAEREQKCDFSDPYFDAYIQLATKYGNPEKITNYKSLKGKKVGVKIGTAASRFLDKISAKYDFKVQPFETGDTMYETLNIGDVVAIMDDVPVIQYNSQMNGLKLELVGKRERAGEFGFAVKKGTHHELLTMFNDGLTYLRKTGEFQKIVDKYTGSKQDQDVQKIEEETTIWGIIKNNWQQLLSGLGETMMLSFSSFVGALLVGILIGLLAVMPQKLLRRLAMVYVDILRGIPLLVLLFFIYYGIPKLIGNNFKINAIVAGIIALILNESAYIAEIVRGGVEAIPIGQMEAARSLGLGFGKSMGKIILPQAIRVMIPSFVNQFVMTLKDTTIVYAVGAVELLNAGRIIIARNMQSFIVYFIIGVIFLVIITILTKLAKVLEKKVKI